MESYGHIVSAASIPRIAFQGLLLGGAAAIAYAFTRFGLPAGAAIALLPAGLCLLWVSLRNPMVAMMGMLMVNYYIMGIGRYLPTFPSGVILDAAIFYNLLILVLQAFVHRVPWRQAGSGLTLVAAVWTVYCLLELVNPETVSASGWISSFRSVAMYFLLTVVLTQITLGRYKYLKYMLAIWSVLTLTAVAKACIQKYVGFTAAENYWLWVLGGHVTHIIYTGVRYFSFFSDAANFGAGMGFSMVVFSIAALYYRNKWMKCYLLLVAAAACYGMLISGTRSALAVPFAGYAVFVLLSRNWKMVLAGIAVLFAAFVFLNFTSIGNSNAIIRRARSAFNTEDASLQVRLDNQARLMELMRGKPFGAGLGHGGGKAKQFAPDAPLSQIPTDSWFVMIWVETGIVGLLLHLGILLYILGYGAWLVLFRLRDEQLKGLITALIAGISGVLLMSYFNEVFGQIPTGVIIYMCMGFIFLAPRFDREIAADGKDLVTTCPPTAPRNRQRVGAAKKIRPATGNGSNRGAEARNIGMAGAVVAVGIAGNAEKTEGSVAAGDEGEIEPLDPNVVKPKSR